MKNIISQRMIPGTVGAPPVLREQWQEKSTGQDISEPAPRDRDVGAVDDFAEAKPKRSIGVEFSPLASSSGASKGHWENY
jgi:hypothetical protein